MRVSNNEATKRARQDFPILNRTVHNKPLIYFDNGASAQKPNAVLQALTHHYSHRYANIHRGLHTLSNEATDDFEKARIKVQKFLNARYSQEIVVTRGATEGINLVANCLSHQLKAGDEIILSVMEHHSNIVPWHFLRERLGVKLVWIGLTPEGDLDEDAYEKAFTSRTKIVALTHQSNVLGTLTPMKKLARIAHEKGALILADGSQAAVHGSVDVQDLDVDFYVITGHKLYAPSGIGALYGRKELLENLPPYHGGGEMIQSVSMDEIVYADLPHRFEAGTPPIVPFIALGTAIDYLHTIGWDNIRDQETRLLTALTTGLRETLGDKLTIFGTSAHKAPLVSFTLKNVHPHDLSTFLDRYGIAIRAGHHCAEPLMKYLGVSATARASLAFYNTVEEVDFFIETLKKAEAFFT